MTELVFWIVWLISFTVSVGLLVGALRRWTDALPSRVVAYTTAAVLLLRVAYRIQHRLVRVALWLANEARSESAPSASALGGVGRPRTFPRSEGGF